MQANQITFHDFKYEPLKFYISMEIGANSRIPTPPFVVQHVIKLVSPLKARRGLEIIPLLVHIFIIIVLMTIVVSQPMDGSERSNK